MDFSDESFFSQFYFTEQTNATVFPSNMEIELGEDAQFYCISEGPNHRMHWTLSDGKPLPNNSRVLGNTLQISSASVTNSGVYVCKVYSSTGKAEDTASLIVRG